MKKLKEQFDNRPIGIFDSGVGGLTVLKEIIKKLPAENTLYVGDTARVPYGTRSPETVMKYSFENANFLMSKGIKILVVACNTASSISLPALAENFPVPVVGVVMPGAKAAVARSRAKKIAVIGTETTIKSSSYKKAIKSIDKSVDVKGIPCPLFVPLVEEGWLKGDVVELTASKYLSPLKKYGADVLILGCTHYPMIKNVIKNTVNPAPRVKKQGVKRDGINITLIDSAAETAGEVSRILEERKMLRNNGSKPRREFFVTDAPQKFIRIGEKFLGHRIANISKITIGG